MIPVIFHGQTVGWMPPIVFRDHFPVYRVPLRSPLPVPPFPEVESGPVKPDIVEFVIKDRGRQGVPGEFHVATLRGLLRIPEFRPEDRALADLQDQR